VGGSLEAAAFILLLFFNRISSTYTPAIFEPTRGQGTGYTRGAIMATETTGISIEQYQADIQKLQSERNW
jgi:hypothetical protein